VPPSGSAAGARPGPDARDGAVTAGVSGDGFRHQALLCRGRGDFLSALRSSIQLSRARAEALLVAIPQHKAELIRPELGDDSAGVTFLDMAELGRNPARIIPAFLAYAAKRRDRHVCCISEPIWAGRTAAEMDEATRHEALVNLAFHDSRVTVLCLYDGTGLPESVIADAACTHPAIVKDRQETASAAYLAPPDLPPRSDLVLPGPPAAAESLGYTDNLRVVRSFVASWARRAGLSATRVPDLVIAVGELTGNTLRHTSGGGTLQIWQTRDEIICQVADTGQIIDPLAWHRPLSGGLLGGNGLWLVNQVCDLVQTRTGPAGTITRLHMRLHPPEATEPQQDHRPVNNVTSAAGGSSAGQL
jgi:anti-sigma regulatory factor (Ser/Thr protein kinase)